MALIAKLLLEGNEYSVMECDYEFTQEIDITGRPSDRPRGGIINIVLMSPDDNDLMIHQWMSEKDATKDGTILLYVNHNSVNAPKTIEFTNGYCIKLYEYFNDNNAMPMYLKISIMASSIVFGGQCEFKMID
jgi:nitrous oxidase accessory protein NosD